MERLTKRIDGRLVFPNELIGVMMTPSNDTMCRILTRLAAYEDTGLEAEEIKVHEAAKYNAGYYHGDEDRCRWIEKELGPIDHLRDLLQAEKAGRLVVLPCKVGDTVYMPVGKWGTITGYEADECDGFHIARDGVLQIKAKCYSGNHGTYGVPGKTVFLTREEAEAALAEKGSTNEDSGSL